MKLTLPQTAPAMSVMTAFPHMHFVGTGLSLWVHRAAPRAGEPADECLINVNQWNFDWQRQYAVDAPRQFGASVAVGSPLPPAPPKKRCARNARTWKKRMTSKWNESARWPMKYLTSIPPTLPVFVVMLPAFD